MAMWTFYCDLSYDGSPPANARVTGYKPRTYVLAGLFATAEKWNRIISGWQATNLEFAVPRFHAAHLNGRKHEYNGWTPETALEYSKKLLGVLNDSGPLTVFVSGVHADCFSRTLSEESLRKLGNPYQLCFNSCVANIASMMDECDSPPEDLFSVVVDKDNGYETVVRSFFNMKNNPRFPNRSRLGNCAPANMENVIALQAADLVAYEWFRWFNTRGRSAGTIREILVPIIQAHVVVERYWDEKNLIHLRDQIESQTAEDGQLILIPPI